jgi:microcystin-dependent protein
MPYLGEVRLFCGKVPPQAWRFCDGALLRIDEYADLFARIEYTYGGDSDHFALPDLRGRVPVHRGPSVRLGQQGGAEQVTLGVANLPQHGHDFNASTALANQPTPGGNTTAQSGTLQLYVQPDPAEQLVALHPYALPPADGYGRSHENMHPYVVVGYVICVAGDVPAEAGGAL